MREPIARPTAAPSPVPEAEEARLPRAFAPEAVSEMEAVDVFDVPQPDAELVGPTLRRSSWLTRLMWGAGGVLLSLALGLAADALIRDLFARYEALGWVGLGVLALFVVALIGLAVRELWALRRLRQLDALRHRARTVLVSDDLPEAQAITREISTVYAPRADLARLRKTLDEGAASLLDGAELIRFGERTLMAPLDARARALTAASARRVALVTAVSPRALVDIAFVGYESIKLASAIAGLYGGRPGLFGALRLAGAVLSHLAVTGGLAAGDGVVEQLVGHGVAARLSARLGEGVLNGLMTVRVGIAAMRVVRPLPFDTIAQPVVRDFLPDLVRVAQKPSGQ